VIPTDEEFKTVTKRVDKPPKNETVEKKKERSRFSATK
jgi:predicted SprT family Zn-dependent metalloprotease